MATLPPKLERFIIFGRGQFALIARDHRDCMAKFMAVATATGQEPVIVDRTGLNLLYPKPVIVDYAMASTLSLPNGGIIHQVTHEQPALVI